MVGCQTYIWYHRLVTVLHGAFSHTSKNATCPRSQAFSEDRDELGGKRRQTEAGRVQIPFPDGPAPQETSPAAPAEEALASPVAAQQASATMAGDASGMQTAADVADDRARALTGGVVPNPLSSEVRAT